MKAKDKRTRYSEKELVEFETLINDKIEKAQNELNILKQSLNRSSESGTGDTNITSKVLEDGAETSADRMVAGA